ncbi:glutathione S-transferase family protein [Elioraea rosea]|uniref:glutathione S-transferase family protein n=1 Tax=Elioraea rosea TaxID=2492390 RepID=UPI0019527142|nr:glutathione S-transferase family protein [Elioraea rosea]
MRLVSFDAMMQPAHRALHPFGQIPTWQEGGLVLFESGAIVLHVAGRHPGLLPDDAQARARAVAWMFAALDTVEPPIWEFNMARVLEGDMAWHAAREPMLKQRVHVRLSQLATRLGDADWLDGGFTSGDLMMITVLRRLAGSGLLEQHPTLAAYVARGEARPAFGRAFAAQLAVFTGQPGHEG